MFHTLLVQKARSSLAALTLAGMAVFLIPLAGQTLPSASAHVGGCRSDPVFTLSSGVKVTLNETISDVSSDVTGGRYVLHVPTGLTIKSVSYSGTLGSKQSFVWYADQALGTYKAASTVLTKTMNIPVTAYMSVGSKSSTSNTGVSNLAIANQFTGA